MKTQNLYHFAAKLHRLKSKAQTVDIERMADWLEHLDSNDEATSSGFHSGGK